MTKKAVPEIRFGYGIPRPIRCFRVKKYDSGIEVLLVSVTPHIEIALRRTGRCSTCCLEPRMLIGSVVNDEFSHYLESKLMGFRKHVLEVFKRAKLGMDAFIVRDIVTVIFQWRWIEGHQPNRIHSQITNVFQLGSQA